MERHTNTDATIIDAIIIGAGVIGASLALGLTRAGFRTLNVDALPAAGYGSTSNSSALVRPFYSYVDGCALAHESRHHWMRWPEFLCAEDERGFATYTECGILMPIAAPGAPGDEATYAPAIRAMKEVGVGYEILSAAEIEARLPGINMQSFGPPRLPDDTDFGSANDQPLSGGILVPEAGYVSDPQLAAHNLQRAAEAKSAEFRFNVKVVTIERDNGRVAGITTDTGAAIKARIVVNVAGPHSSKINALAGVLDDMQAGTRALRHEVAHVPAPKGLDYVGTGPAIADMDAGIYTRPEVGNHMLIGTMDPDCDAPDYVDADDYNGEFTEQWTRQVWRAALRFPALGIPNTAQGVIGLYDVTEDWVPIYDRSSLPGFYMAVGTSGNQFKNAPVIGGLMAALITACEAGHDHDADPVRFRLEHLGRDVNIGTFSRLRAISAETSGTVMA